MTLPMIDASDGLAVSPHVVFTKDGDAWLSVVKASYVLKRGSSELEPWDRSRPVRGGEVWWGDPATTAPQFPADVTGRKTATDVIVVAKAHAPEGKPATRLDVAMSLGPVSKSLRVFGLRAWQQQGAGLSAPRPFVEQELRYDAAWGGIDLTDPSAPRGDMRNPVGRGIQPGALGDQLAPCIEDPAEPIVSAATRPAPAGFGPLGAHWSPRRERAGTFDEGWRRTRAPMLPADFDERHFQCASPGLIADPPLRGGEPIGLWNLTPGGGAVDTRLPNVKLAMAIDGPELQREDTPHVDTVILDTLHVPDGATLVVEMVWRTLVPVPRRMAEHTLLVDRV